MQVKSRNQLPGDWLTQKTTRIHQSIELSFNVVPISDKALESLSGRQEGKGQLLQPPGTDYQHWGVLWFNSIQQLSNAQPLSLYLASSIRERFKKEDVKKLWVDIKTVE